MSEASLQSLTRKERVATRPRATGRAGREDIYEQVYVAILEHRLPPGTKLGEDRLAKIFDVSRARVREVLARLAHDGVIELVPQKGAHVARPTPEQARDLFEMRRLVEPGIVKRLVERLDAGKVKALRAHIDEEHDARRRNDKRAVIRLSGEFHTLLAELTGSEFMLRSMRELSTLTCLIISLYDAPTSEACRDDEHAEIVDAIVAKDAARAGALVNEHLDHIEASLDLSDPSESVDLEAVFSEALAR